MKLIATDLDRTLIPNGNHRITKGSMHVFSLLLKKSKTPLVYVTGRNKKLILDAIKRYNLPRPLYCIADVGSRIYEYKKGKLVEVEFHKKQMKKEWKHMSADMIREKLSSIKGLQLQPPRFQNDFKVSYYAKDKRVLSKIKLSKIKYRIIYSRDLNRKVNQLDILPKCATKKTTLALIAKRMKAKKVLYAGDSGNDIDALTGGWYGVLVNNASDSVKKQVRGKKKVYIAKGGPLGNGNYVNGILEGIAHFDFL